MAERCPRCKRILSDSEFYPRRRQGDLQGYCKKCKDDYLSEWKPKKPNFDSIRSRAWRKRNPNWGREHKRRWRKAHPDYYRKRTTHR